jgi:hypothetical protein
MEEKIIEILKNYEGWVDRSMTNTCVWPDNYKEVANDIVKLFAIPVVVFSEAELKAKLEQQKEEMRQWLEGEGYELLAERL